MQYSYICTYVRSCYMYMCVLVITIEEVAIRMSIIIKQKQNYKIMYACVSV